MEMKPGIIALESARKTGERINSILSEWYGGGDYIIPSDCPRFGSGEGKGIIRKSVRDRDIYILVDVCNNSLTYKMDGKEIKETRKKSKKQISDLMKALEESLKDNK